MLAGVAVLVFAVSQFTDRSLSRAYAEEGEATALTVARHLGTRLDRSDLARDARVRSRLAETRKVNPTVTFLSVHRRRGRALVRVAASGRGHAHGPRSPKTLKRPVLDEHRNRGGHTLELLYPLRDGSKVVGAVELHYDLAPLDAALSKRQKAFVLTVASVALLVALLVYLVLGRSVFRPLDELRRATYRIMSGEKGARLGWRRDDEIGVLGRDFDRMAGALEESQERLEGLALQDPLTRLPNSRAFEDRLGEELRRALRDYYPIAVVALDLDSFKSINDNWGHHAGDEALQKLAKTLTAELRPGDICGRIGGDEFLLALPQANAAHASEVLTRLRNAVGGIQVGPARQHLTFSAGISEFPGHGVDQAELIRYADAAMYWAKAGGRDRYAIYSPDSNYAVETTENVEQTRQSGLVNTVHALARAVDAKDGYTAQHSRRVSVYTTALAATYEMNTRQLEMLKTAGLLHDVGKIGIPDAILTKRKRLSADEFAVMRRHSELGRDILAGAGMPDIARWVYHLHERYDGRGYPDGLAGDQIPLESRLMHASDALEAMTSSRVYRKASSVEYAIEELKASSGTQLDPDVVNRLVRLLREGRLEIPDEPIEEYTGFQVIQGAGAESA